MSTKSKSLRSLGDYKRKQSDDEFQRHKASRHHREGSGQDRFGQQQAVLEPTAITAKEAYRTDLAYRRR